MDEQRSAEEYRTRGEAREQRRRPRMPVHGRSLEAIINSIRKRAQAQRAGGPKRKRR